MNRLIGLVLICVACAEAPEGRRPRERPASAGPTEPDRPQQVPHVTEHDVDGFEGDRSAILFDDGVLHTVDIALSPESYASLDLLPYEYVEGEVTVDGLRVGAVGVRLRGKLGSFRPIGDKPKLRIDFDRYVDGQELFGVESLTLNSNVADCSALREKLAYRIYAEAGSPATRVAWAEVTLNGAPYGLYTIVETQDERWLEHAWPDPTGNLYDGKYIWDGGVDYILLDFTADVHHGYALEEGVDVGNADIFAITDALDLHRGTPGFYAALEPLIDWPHFHAYFAAEQWTAQPDGYAAFQNNYRVYFDPAAGGRLKHVTTDLDQAFPSAIWEYWRWPSGRIVDLCFDDDLCNAAHRAVVGEFLDDLDAVGLAADLAAWDQLTLDAALADPKASCTRGDVISQRDALRRWTVDREAAVRDFWSL